MSEPMYAHCANCYPQRPPDQTPAQWVRIQVSVEHRTLVIWCNRCELEVARFELAEPLDPKCGCHECQKEVSHA